MTQNALYHQWHRTRHRQPVAPFARRFLRDWRTIAPTSSARLFLTAVHGSSSSTTRRMCSTFVSIASAKFLGTIFLRALGLRSSEDILRNLLHGRSVGRFATRSFSGRSTPTAKSDQNLLGHEAGAQHQEPRPVTRIAALRSQTECRDTKRNSKKAKISEIRSRYLRSRSAWVVPTWLTDQPARFCSKPIPNSRLTKSRQDP